MASEDTSIIMKFVDDDVFEVFEQFYPFGVMGEDSGVEHIRVGEDDMTSGSDGLPCILGGVAVVGEDPDLLGKKSDGLVEFGPLILGEGFSGEQVDGSGGGVLEDGVKNREVVAQRLSRGGGRDDDDVLPFRKELPREMLM